MARICFISPTRELHGGTLVMLSFARALAAGGHEIHLVAPATTDGISIENSIIQHLLPLKNRWLSFFTFQLPYLPALRKALPVADVYIPIYTPLLYLLTKCQLADTAKVVFLCQDAFELPYIGWFNSWAIRQPGVRRIITKVIAVAPTIAQQFTTLSKIPCEVIPNGIDITLFHPSTKRRQNFILFVGRPNAAKGYGVYKQVIHKLRTTHPEVTGVVVAPGITEHEVDGIRHIAFKNREQLAELYQTAKLYLNCSVAESFGLPPLEAMACATPVVLTKTAGSKIYARHGENCLSAPVGDERELANLCRELLDDEELYAAIAAAGCTTALAYDAGSLAERYRTTVEKLLS